MAWRLMGGKPYVGFQRVRYQKSPFNLRFEPGQPPLYIQLYCLCLPAPKAGYSALPYIGRENPKLRTIAVVIPNPGSRETALFSRRLDRRELHPKPFSYRCCWPIIPATD